jgi:YD repeat-containing protein
MAHTAHSACRDCAQPGFGGPSENRFTAYDSICRGDACRVAGFPQVLVNTSNLTLFVHVTDLAFGGPAPALALDRSYNLDDTHAGPFGPGWSFNLGESLTPDTDGSLVLRRGSGRMDRFASAVPGSTNFFAVSSTADTLLQNTDGTYTLAGTYNLAGAIGNFASPATRTFSADGRLLAILDSGGSGSGAVRVALDYDTAGRLTAAHYRGNLIKFAYDSANHINSIADDAGRSVNFSYTADGRLAGQTNADGQTVAYQYDSGGNLTSIAYAGGVTAIAYNSDPPFASVASVTTPDGAVRLYGVPRTPTEIRVTDGNGDASLFVSSASGLLQSVTDSAGNQVAYAYDVSGNRIGATNGAGEVTTFTYDSRNNLTGIKDTAGNKWSADYATAGPAHITDPNGNVWSLQYDAAGNLTGVTNPASGAVTATRSPSGQITGLTDARGNQTGYAYNSDGLPATFVDALSGKWTYQYDGAARAVTRTDPGGASLTAGYDARNRIAGLTSGTAQSAFDYSGMQHDSLNRLTSYTDSFGNQVTYTYDLAGQLTAIAMPGGKSVTYQYDHAHRLSKVSDWGGNFALYRYDAAGWPGSVSVSGGPVTIYQYDGARNLKAIVSTGPDGTPVAGYRYTFDAAGNRTAVSALEPIAALPALAANTVGYDAANHPTTRGDGSSYQYDARGNLTAIQGAHSISLGYDAFGRLTSFNADSSTSYTYDGTGLRAVRTVNGNGGAGRLPPMARPTSTTSMAMAMWWRFPIPQRAWSTNTATTPRAAWRLRMKPSRICSAPTAKPAGWTMATASSSAQWPSTRACTSSPSCA